MELIQIKVTPEMKRIIRKMASQRKTTMTQILTEAMEMMIASKAKVKS